jgi:hypothetical protein
MTTMTETGSNNKKPRQRPVIQVNHRPLDHLLEETWNALGAKERIPLLFARQGKIVELHKVDERLSGGAYVVPNGTRAWIR